MDHQDNKVERFLKLGYSHGDILRVLESLRKDAQTNDILEELIKTCHSRGDSNRNSASVSPKLVPRGCSLPESCPKHPLPRPSPMADREPADIFRPVVIDGSNVAMSHGDKKVFSCRGLQLAVKWFWDRGLRNITVFVPLWRKEQPRPEAPITDQQILHDLERRKILVYTPSRCVNGKRVVCYDDRYIVKLAFDSDGIIVSNDNYRDLQTEKPQWKRFIEERLLMYTFANDKFMPPDDPLGRNGPTIDNFLRKNPLMQEKQQHCPYEKKCTYGVKCKFYHPERVNQSQLSVADELRAMSRPGADRALAPGQGTSCSLALYPEAERSRHSPPCHSADMDEAIGSLESQMPRLYIQDVAQHTSSTHSYAYSSGIGSCGHSNEPYLSYGSYSSSEHRPTSGGYHHHQQQQQQHSSQCSHKLLRAPPGSSCPALCPRGSPAHVAERQCYRAAFPHTHSLPEDQWVGQYRLNSPTPNMRSCGQAAKAPGGDPRTTVRSQLSTLFPPSTVEQVMSAYPHVMDMAKLIGLIQRYRTNDIPS